MTHTDIIEMARQAGVDMSLGEHWSFFIEELKAFAKLVAAKAIKEALAQPKEPVAWEQFYPDIGKPQLTYPPQGIYYTPPQRTWVGLSDEEIERIKLLTFEKEINTNGEEQEAVNLDQLIRAAEQLCKEKNYE